MSFVQVPDPFPGRCLNLRPRFDAHGYTQTVRCLEYEAEEHVCRFQSPTVLSTTSGGATICNTALSEPKPWVKPEDRTA